MECPACQTELPDGANFCHKCGQALKSAPPEAKPHLTPEPERKHVTAVFSDLTGYTSMTKKLDPEQIHQNVAACFRILKNEIRFQFGGTLTGRQIGKGGESCQLTSV